MKRHYLRYEQTISDDDLCASCKFLNYNPGELSSCTRIREDGTWPGQPDADCYIISCDAYEKPPKTADGREWKRDPRPDHHGWVPPDWSEERMKDQKRRGLIPDGLPGPKTSGSK